MSRDPSGEILRQKVAVGDHHAVAVELLGLTNERYTVYAAGTEQ